MQEMKSDFVIVGAGLSGAVMAERIASVLKKEVVVIERREHIGGNIYDYRDENGILIHKYGPHAFHTNSKKVWDYLSRFTEWHYYSHKVHAIVDGTEIPLPFNLNSLHALFGGSLASRLEDALIATFGYGARVPVLEMIKTSDKELVFLADYVYRKIFLGYTLKQWGVRPEDLEASVTARVPVLVSRDNRHFQDRYQAIPKEGYTKMIERLLDHKLIRLEMGCDFNAVRNKVRYQWLVHTGPVDEFFGFKHRTLPYRSVEFTVRTCGQEFFQQVAQVNYPEDHDFTRITEFKHFLDAKAEATTIAFEYPRDYVHGTNEPYYPIPRQENTKTYEFYRKEADAMKNVIFLGRLAEYRYYNMDQAVGRALTLFEERLDSSLSR